MMSIGLQLKFSKKSLAQFMRTLLFILPLSVSGKGAIYDQCYGRLSAVRENHEPPPLVISFIFYFSMNFLFCNCDLAFQTNSVAKVKLVYRNIFLTVISIHLSISRSISDAVVPK